MNKDTMEKLAQLRLPGMLRAYKEQYRLNNIEEMTFEQRLTLLVDAEIDSRHNHLIERLIKNAQLSDKGASIEDIKYYADRQLNKDLIEDKKYYQSKYYDYFEYSIELEKQMGVYRNEP